MRVSLFTTAVMLFAVTASAINLDQDGAAAEALKEIEDK